MKNKNNHGGRRIAGEGKKIGKPTEDMGTNPQRYQDYLDDETIAKLKNIHKVRSIAIRIAVKQYKK